MADIDKLGSTKRTAEAAQESAVAKQTAASAGVAGARRTGENGAVGPALTRREAFVRVSIIPLELAFKAEALKQFHEYYLSCFDELDQIEGHETSDGRWAADNKYGLSERDQMVLEDMIFVITRYNPQVLDKGIFKKSDFVKHLNHVITMQTEAQKDNFVNLLRTIPLRAFLSLRQIELIAERNGDGNLMNNVFFTVDELKLLISKLGRIAFMPCNESVINVQLKSAEEVDVLIAYVKEIDGTQATQHLRLSYTVKRVQLVGLEDEHIARLKAVLRSAIISVKKTGDLIKAARP
jgi:hypothetical protein